MHELDKFNFFDGDKIKQWWMPCPRVCAYNGAEAKCWCDAQSDRLSASLVNRNVPPTAKLGEIPVYKLDDAKGVGLIFHPSYARVLCSYAEDVHSYNFQCTPPGVTRECVPGCMTDGVWNHNAWRLVPGVQSMLRAFEARETRMGASEYNEVIVDAQAFEAALPQSLEAIYYHEEIDGARDLARSMQIALAEHLGKKDGRAVPPIVRFNPTRWNAPFGEW